MTTSSGGLQAEIIFSRKNARGGKPRFRLKNRAQSSWRLLLCGGSVRGTKFRHAQQGIVDIRSCLSMRALAIIRKSTLCAALRWRRGGQEPPVPRRAELQRIADRAMSTRP